MGKSKIASIANVFHNSIYNLILLSELLGQLNLQNVFEFVLLNRLKYWCCCCDHSSVNIQPLAVKMGRRWHGRTDDGTAGHLGRWNRRKIEPMTRQWWWWNWVIKMRTMDLRSTLSVRSQVKGLKIRGFGNGISWISFSLLTSYFELAI